MRSVSLFPKILLPMILVLLLGGCELVLPTQQVDNTSNNVNITGLAVYVAQRDGDGEWQTIAEGNQNYDPAASSLLVKNPSKRFSVLMVCPATAEDVPHRVYFYLGTVSELPNINHQCRKSAATVDQGTTYGNVKGVDVNIGERARLAIGQNRGEWVYEAFAYRDVKQVYEMMGSVGKIQPDNSYIPERYYINKAVILDDPLPIRDIDFRGLNTADILTTTIPDSVKATATVSGIPATGDWHSSVSYVTSRRTFFTLAEGQQQTLNYYGVPIYVSGVGTPIRFQGEKEGHEFSAEIYDSQKRVVSGIRHYFKKSHDIAITLPSAVLSVSSLENSLLENYQRITGNWSLGDDPNHGKADLFHWVVRGEAAPGKLCAKCGSFSNLLEWHILVTPGWMSSSSNYQVSVDPVPLSISDNDLWAPAWNFSSDPGISWELRAYFSEIDQSVIATDNKQYLDVENANVDTGTEGITPPEALLNHLFNREYVNGLSFVQLATFSS